MSIDPVEFAGELLGMETLGGIEGMIELIEERDFAIKYNERLIPVELVKMLMSDDDYYRSWKDNISMAFQNEMSRSKNSRNIKDIADTAANSFLCTLIGKTNETNSNI